MINFGLLNSILLFIGKHNKLKINSNNNSK
jgi:hypothetical protein